jgi:hypothetical protein
MFKVRRHTSIGRPEAKVRDAEANTELEAAEMVCGMQLTPEHRDDRFIRADVRRLDDLQNHHFFYEKP